MSSSRGRQQFEGGTRSLARSLACAARLTAWRSQSRNYRKDQRRYTDFRKAVADSRRVDETLKLPAWLSSIARQFRSTQSLIVPEVAHDSDPVAAVRHTHRSIHRDSETKQRWCLSSRFAQLQVATNQQSRGVMGNAIGRSATSDESLDLSSTSTTAQGSCCAQHSERVQFQVPPSERSGAETVSDDERHCQRPIADERHHSTMEFYRLTGVI